MDDFERLKRKVAALQERKAQAEGALGELLRQLKKEFGCKTLAQARRLLVKLQDGERRAAVRYTKAKTEFERKWKKVLDAV